ncbi:proline-specific peptidase [Crepidotus variabilis]|uniref:Proline-specific peptidase n=1 Tax=Crepidotus variabilis TaxID=179855 RepID=A0A9P6EJP9_9AGAR|nr:proline-specific peptidase [Crepidotus variabilis]
MSKSNQVTTGELDFKIPTLDIVAKTWYKVIGDLKSNRPLVALHGGPGLNTEYLEILSNITNAQSRALVLYDQIGNGRSTHLAHKKGDTSFWSENLFLTQLDELLEQLGINDDYDLLGHSWGGMLAARHATRQPKGLKRLVMFSSPASVDLWIETGHVYRKELPQDVQDILDKNENDGTIHSEEYRRAMKHYDSLHGCTIQPVPEPIVKALTCMMGDPTVRESMYGPRHFESTGVLKNWTIIPDAHRISVSTLVLHGKVDQASRKTIEPLLKEIRTVESVEFEKSGHMAHFEETDKFMSVVGKFLSLA